MIKLKKIMLVFTFISMIVCNGKFINNYCCSDDDAFNYYKNNKTSIDLFSRINFRHEPQTFKF